MAAASIILGLLILCFTVVDVLFTVLVLGGGAGWQTSLIANKIWNIALRLHKPSSKRSHSLLRLGGPLIILAALFVWVIELCVAWALIFIPSAFKSVVDVTFIDRFLFAGRSIIGRSGNSPSLAVENGGWEVVNWAAGVSGVVLVSVGLAYVLPVLGAVAHKRSIAVTLNTLGRSPKNMQELLGRSRDGQFGLHLLAAVSSLSLSAERHRSYPVLHYFHSKDAHASLAPAVAKVALLLELDEGGERKIDPAVIIPLRRAICDLLEALGRMGLSDFASKTSAVGSKLEPLLVDPLASDANDRGPQVGWLKAYVAFDGWDWKEATGLR